MNREYIRDHQVIERYLRGALTPDEEQAFEEAYLGDPEILEELQLAERLRQSLKDLDGAGGLNRLMPKARWLQALSSPQYAMAASVLFAVTLVISGALYRENLDLREGALSASAATRFVPLDSLRGGSARELPAPPEDEWTVLLLDPGATEYDRYRAVLLRGDEQEVVWSRADLTPGPDGRISIGLPGRALRPARYEALLAGRMDDWPAGRFDDISITLLTVVPRD